MCINLIINVSGIRECRDKRFNCCEIGNFLEGVVGIVEELVECKLRLCCELREGDLGFVKYFIIIVVLRFCILIFFT